MALYILQAVAKSELLKLRTLQLILMKELVYSTVCGNNVAKLHKEVQGYAANKGPGSPQCRSIL
jgi:hypothetical protein